MKRLSLLLVALAFAMFSCKPEIEKPTVVTKSVGEVTETTAKIVGQVTADGGAEVTERGVCWSADGTPTVLDYRVKDADGGLGTYTSNLTDLESNTTYYVRTFATNEAGTSYGEEKSFTTEEVKTPGTPEDPEDPNDPNEPNEPNDPETPEDPEDPNGPVVATNEEVSDITVNSAVCGGDVISGGDAVVIARGVCWSTNPNPTVYDSFTIDGSGIGTYTSNISNLTDNTTYYVRAYATNASGATSYGGERSFTTLEKLLPTVITKEVKEIAACVVTSRGEVTFDGNLEVTSRGVCWSTSQNPTINDNKTEDGSGTGSYTSQLINLVSQTTYYVRAYAINEKGVAYGNEMSFTTSPTTGTINGYDWVDLGLPSGLKWATCNVGANEPEDYGDYYAWGETETKEEYTEENCTTYGVQMSDISGNAQYDVARKQWGSTWRMPTEEEQQELLDNCEWQWTTQSGVDGYKVTGPNGNHIFLPAAGYRRESSLFDAVSFGYYWSSTPYESYGGNAYLLSFGSVAHLMYIYSRYRGLSVRPVTE